jgi:hypothetical protein
MAKAIFHRHQRVYVVPVGTWAVIERIVPVWVKGFDEPVRVAYDCGLGREFAPEELSPIGESTQVKGEEQIWRVARAKNKWQDPDETTHHPFPGTFPIVLTEKGDWGGWRVPGAEYDRNPGRIEYQARLISLSPSLLKLATDLEAYCKDNPDHSDQELFELSKRATSIRKLIDTETSNNLKSDKAA